MITYTQFLESDVGSYLMSYFKELMEKNSFINEHEDDLRKNTNIIDKITDNALYDIYETLINSVEEIEDEAQDYLDELESDINDGVYED